MEPQQVSFKTPFYQKRILLGVTGSIAAYKTVELASKMTQMEAEVDVILTESACKFVTPLSFQSVTGRKVYTEADLWGGEGHVTHITLGRVGDLLVIAPASANTMAKIAHGIADNLLSITALAARCPILIAPAMDGGMYGHPATQKNVEILRGRNVQFIGPAAGHLASGLVGVGRMEDPEIILGTIRRLLAQNGPLAGKKIVVTAGGTQEPIDPVRAIMNRSTGKQGFALAQAALDLGANVTLIAGPTALATPAGVNRIDITTAEEMKNAVFAETNDADGLIMAAAVADFRPAVTADQKIKKEDGIPEIKLSASPDILKEVSLRKDQTHKPTVIVGFAAESQDLIENARKKMVTKKLDLIVANNIQIEGSGFGYDTNRVSLLTPDGKTETLGIMSKYEVSRIVLQKILQLLIKEH
jgi:phosphopantothenoylcysteine decarboxylase / phosphopantothenate---cysteine ligase